MVVRINSGNNNFAVNTIYDNTPRTNAVATQTPATTENNPSSLQNTVTLNNIEQGSYEPKAISFNVKDKVKEKSNDNILYVGLNPETPHEAAELKKSAVGKIDFVGTNNKSEISLNGKKYKLDENSGIDKLATDLNLNGEQKEKLSKIIKSLTGENSGFGSFDFSDLMRNIRTGNFNLGLGNLTQSPVTSEKKEEKIEVKSKGELMDSLKELNLGSGVTDKLGNGLANTGAIFKSPETGKSYNLSIKEDSENFVNSLGLPKEQSDKLNTFLSDSKNLIKDELAQIIYHFSKAEKGGEIPSRLVISGHSSGDKYWGEENGTLKKEDIKKLAEIMPKAAEKIEDFALSACYSGSKNSLEEYKEIFPNLKTFMGYVGSAPGTHSGAVNHVKKWEKATRGESTELKQELFSGTRKGENVSTWTEKNGYTMDKSKQKAHDYEELTTNINSTMFKFMEQDEPIANPSTGELRQMYEDIHSYLGNQPDLDEATKTSLNNTKDQAIRLLFYPQISTKFNETYKDELSKGFKAADMPIPDFSKLSRAETREKIKELEGAMVLKVSAVTQERDDKIDAINKADPSGSEETTKKIQQIVDEYQSKIENPVPEMKKAIDLLKNGLINMSSEIIPANWI